MRVRGSVDVRIAATTRCYDPRMFDDLDLLATRLTELTRLLQSLRTENQQLRSQLAQAGGQLDAMRTRVDEAGRRLDLLMERLPGHASSPKAPWNT